MNHTFKIIWSDVAQTYVTVSEHTKAKGKSSKAKAIVAAGTLSVAISSGAYAVTDVGLNLPGDHINAPGYSNPANSDPITAEGDDAYGIYSESDLYSFTNRGAISSIANDGNASGVSLADYDIINHFTNFGSISATSFEGSATGLKVGDIDRDFDNQGAISANASATSTGYFYSTAVDAENFNDDVFNHGTISASVNIDALDEEEGFIYGYATGMVGNFNGNDFLNTGSISASASNAETSAESASLFAFGLEAYDLEDFDNGSYGNTTSSISATVSGNADDFGSAVGVSSQEFGEDNGGESITSIEGDIRNHGIISAEVNAGNAEAYGMLIQSDSDNMLYTDELNLSDNFTLPQYSVDGSFLNTNQITASATATSANFGEDESKLGATSSGVFASNERIAEDYTLANNRVNEDTFNTDSFDLGSGTVFNEDFRNTGTISADANVDSSAEGKLGAAASGVSAANIVGDQTMSVNLVPTGAGIDGILETLRVNQIRLNEQTVFDGKFDNSGTITAEATSNGGADFFNVLLPSANPLIESADNNSFLDALIDIGDLPPGAEALLYGVGAQAVGVSGINMIGDISNNIDAVNMSNWYNFNNLLDDTFSRDNDSYGGAAYRADAIVFNDEFRNSGTISALAVNNNQSEGKIGSASAISVEAHNITGSVYGSHAFVQSGAYGAITDASPNNWGYGGGGNLAYGGDATIGDTIAFNDDFVNTVTGVISAEASLEGAVGNEVYVGLVSAQGISATNKVGDAVAGDSTAYGSGSYSITGSASIGDTYGFFGDFDNEGLISAQGTLTATAEGEDGSSLLTTAGVSATNKVGRADAGDSTALYGATSRSGNATIGDTIGFGGEFNNIGTILAQSTLEGEGKVSAVGVGVQNYVGEGLDVIGEDGFGFDSYYGAYSEFGNAIIGDTIGFVGDFDNAGLISAQSTVEGEGKVSAVGVGVQNFVNSAYGGGAVDSRGDIYGFAGDFNNGGDILASATAIEGRSVQASALDIFNSVDFDNNDFDGNGSIVGIVGDFTNSGNMIASATSGTNEDGYGSYAIASGISIENNAYGGEDDSYSIGGDFLNDANAIIAATAVAGDEADAYGVYTDEEIYGTVTNNGIITASATASEDDSSASAIGFQSQYIADDILNAGSVTALSSAGWDADAYGFFVEDSIDTHFENTGTIFASAQTYNHNPEDFSSAYAAGIYVGDDIEADGEEDVHGFTNSGNITALASVSGGLNSEATTYGLYVYDELDGEVYNSGNITAISTTSALVDNGQARSFGMSIGDYIEYKFENSGYIRSSAISYDSNGDAEAYGVFVTDYIGDLETNNDFINTSLGRICVNAISEYVASAYGVYVGDYIGGGFYNNGLISAIAQGDYETAFGVYIDRFENGGDFVNNGTIVGRNFNEDTGYSLYVNSNFGYDFINNGLMHGAIHIEDSNDDDVFYNNGLINTRLEDSYVDGDFIQSDQGTFQLSVNGSINGQLNANDIIIRDGSTIAVHVLPGEAITADYLVAMSADNVLTTDAEYLNIKDTSVAYNFTASKVTDYVPDDPSTLLVDETDENQLLVLTVADTGMTNIASAVASQNLKSGEGLAQSLDLALNNFEDLPSKMQDLFYKLGESTNAGQVKHTVETLLPTSTGNANLYSHDLITQMSQVVDLRQSYNKGAATGDQFYGNSSFWFKPFGSYADQNRNEGVSGYNANSFGAMFGADTTAGALGSIGASFGYAHTNLDPDNVASSVKLRTYQATVYGTKNVSEQTDFSWHVGGGMQDNRSSRTTDGFGQANANYDSDFVNAGAQLSYAANISDNQKFIPSLRMNYTRVSDDGYQESGLGALNLMVDKVTSQRLVLGVDGKYVYKPNGETNLSANLGVGYDVLQDNDPLRARFQGGPGYNCCAAQPVVSFNVATMDPSPWIVRGGLGASYNITNSVDVGARYDLNVKENYFDQMASARVVVKF